PSPDAAAKAGRSATKTPRRSSCKDGSMTTQLPDAEATLVALAERMRGAVAYEAAFVGIYSGGAWLAERLPALVPGDHPVGFIDVSFYRDDYSTTGLKGGSRRTSPPFDVNGASIALGDDRV